MRALRAGREARTLALLATRLLMFFLFVLWIGCGFVVVEASFVCLSLAAVVLLAVQSVQSLSSDVRAS